MANSISCPPVVERPDTRTVGEVGYVRNHVELEGEQKNRRARRYGSGFMKFNGQGSVDHCDVCGQAHIFDSREEWERKFRIVYIDMLDNCHWVSGKPSDYATPGEITSGIRTLGQAWRDKLKDLKEAKREAR